MDGYEQFQAPHARLEEGKASIAMRVDLASRGARLGAALADSFALGLSGGLVALATIPFNPRVMIMGVALVVIALVIWNMVWIHRYGQTIGKRVVGIKMVRSDGSRVSLGRVIGLRILPMAVLRFIPVLGSFIGLADVLCIFRESRKCLHDDIADTMVVTV